MVRHGSDDRTVNCAWSRCGAALSRTDRTNKRTGNLPVLHDVALRAAARPVTSLGPTARLESVRQPRGGNDEQRRQEKPEQGVQPDQRDVEETKPDTDPEGAQRTVSFQASAPESEPNAGSIVARLRRF